MMGTSIGDMRAWSLSHPAPAAEHSLRLVQRGIPAPGRGEILVAVRTCGVCRTDLHLVEGDILPRRPGVVPGHEVVGNVAERGPAAERFALGERIGIPWLRSTCGICRFCERGDENLCIEPRFTGWDADGGYAEYAVVDEQYAYRLPAVFSDSQAAPLLCAGIIGYRALRRAALPPGGRLGLYGFGGSAHLTAQVALHEGATVHVMTRAVDARQLALSLGCASAQGADEPPPEPLDAAILFAPVGTLVLPAMAALDRGGRLAIAGIHLSEIPALDYDSYLFEEREIVSVTANTRRDGEEFLALAAQIPIRPTTTDYSFEMADVALEDLANDAVNGAAVIRVSGDG
ncbi:MAG TPA: zinc-dependent alcohol dehydrogenase family protein, partial [Acidimicrobiales bacterium]|nr:zinc-dependent alcohol dehydrogenase family protein [Acidimicrobiales bacterium]